MRVDDVEIRARAPDRGWRTGQRHDDEVALGDLHPVDVDVLPGEPRERHLHHGEVPQQLLDERAGGRVVVVNELERLAVLEQHQRAERQHAGGGLEPAGQYAVGEAGQLLVGDLVAVLAR